MLPAIEAAGFSAFATTGATLSSTPERPALLKLDLDREDRDLREGFATRLARVRATAVLALCAAWRPDLLVCDEIDFGAMVAAERLGLPNELRAEHGLPMVLIPI